MSDDRELLKLAARTAGRDVWTDCDGNVYTDTLIGVEVRWNPLTDDGDALRLAVDLGLMVSCGSSLERAYAGRRGVEDRFEYFDLNDGDKRKATRRAIVRAAAEIGREMQ